MHLDDTQISSPRPTEPRPPAPASPASPSGLRSEGRILLVAALLAVALVLVGAWIVASDAESSAERLSASATTVPDGDTFVVDEPTEESPAEPVEPDPDPEPEPDPDPDPEPEPEPEPEPDGPCELLEPGQNLAVTPGPVELPVGQFAGELIVTNCGEDVVGWTASTLAPAVQLGVDQGLLAPGAELDVQFAVDHTQMDGTSMFFTITVSEFDHDTGVMVKVTKPVINPDLLIKPELIFED